jgi:hypothetical protein
VPVDLSNFEVAKSDDEIVGMAWIKNPTSTISEIGGTAKEKQARDHGKIEKKLKLSMRIGKMKAAQRLRDDES